tara:strand:- start:1728 stop:2693 length:966 start_codon:yes stop_codon:yes gene_type:complete
MPKSKIEDPIEELQKRAEEHIQNGRSQAAIDELDRASEDLISYPHLFKLKGIARLLQGNSTEARLIFDQLDGCFGDDPEFLNIYGVVLRRERDLSKSAEVYKRGLEIRPEEPALLSNYGNLLIDLNKFDEASIVLNKAIKIAPNHKDARQNLVRLNRCIGQVSSKSFEDNKVATTALEPKSNLDESLVSNDEEAASDWLNLAAISQRDKNFEEALIFSRKAIEAQPGLSAAYKVAGEVLFAMGKRDDAERMLMYGVILGEDDDNSISNIACIAALKGNGKLAYTLFHRVLANSPEHQNSITNLKNLKSQIQDNRYTFTPVV